MGSSPVARRYWGNHCCFLFLRVLRCFSSPRSPPYKECTDSRPKAAGLSHSEIRGSRAICAYPRLIAAYHVLHRLREPRHPPCALTSFSNISGTATCRQRPPRDATARERDGAGRGHEPERPHAERFLSLVSCLCQHVKDLYLKVENNGFEPLTPCLQSRCSSQLS